MTSEQPKKPAGESQRLNFSKPKKLARLPARSKVHKRPLNHAPIPSPRTGASSPKIIYVSHNSPFMSIITRTRKLLSEIDKRSMGPIDLSAFESSSSATPSTANVLEHLGKMGEERREEVLIRGTGKAIEKVCYVAAFLQKEKDLRVRMRTGSVGAVDDIEGGDGAEESRVRMLSMMEAAVSLR